MAYSARIAAAAQFLAADVAEEEALEVLEATYMALLVALGRASGGSHTITHTR